ncbi:Nicotinate-nucleotide adenylyltransferase [Bacillus sp. 349Y]|nr:Nicotinate-nucleotide adenylyltransferase [Bacillus sp. 349Y]
MKKIGFYGGKFLPLHQGHVYALIQASTMVEELYVVLSHSEKRDREICARTDFPYVPATVRLRWLHQLTKDMPHVHIVSIEDDAGDEDYDWRDGAALIKEAIGKPIEAVFSSERGYSDIFRECYPGAEHIILDEERIVAPISATMIRTDGVYRHWGMIPSVARSYFVKKVVVVGTESCGKSTLVRNLATAFNTNYVAEYGRTRCEEIGGYDGVLLDEDYPMIAYEQQRQVEKASILSHRVLFVDTEATVTQFYSELYNAKHQDVLDSIAKAQEYDLYLFLEPDVEWVDDGWRMHGEEAVRRQNHERLQKLLEENGIPFTTLSGSYREKWEEALRLVNEILE